jgi:hypothetical protein
MAACRSPAEIFRSIHGKNRLWIAKALWIFFAILLLPATAADLPTDTLFPSF